MMGAIDWVVVSAIVQATSAVAVVGLTYFLVRFTGRYVAAMQQANSLQEQANTISAALVARAAAQAAPFLVAALGGGSSMGGSGDWEIIVQNRGGGLAHDITVETTRGDITLDSLGEGDEKRATLHVDSDWDSRPEMVRFWFVDAVGTKWGQKPSQLPEEFD